ncbi:GrpB family protein [Klebsiella sp. R445]
MTLTSKITLYNPNWPGMFVAERNRIAFIFGDHLVAIHHVGSTAIPGLAAKPEIDLLVEVSIFTNAARVDTLMGGFGYIRGCDLSAGHHFYRKDIDGIRTHKVHVCESGHKDISSMLSFRDILRQDVELKSRYQALKFKLEAENTSGIKEYLAHKMPFIEAVLKQNR